VSEPASHTTVLVMAGNACRVREGPELVQVAIEASGSDWVWLTADPEGESILVNVAQIQYVARERTPVEMVGGA
jgi:hypothetical protein